MPTLAVNNGLALSRTPSELTLLMDFKIRLISILISFRKTLSMHKYGNHYRVNGPCVNVPKTCNNMCDIFSPVTDGVQMYPMKVKWKFSLKTLCVSYTRADIVMNVN